MEALWWGLPAAALIVAVVEVLKRVGLSSQWAGVAAVVIGAVGGLAAHVWADSPAVAAVVQGIVAGLAAAGLWSTTKNALGG